MPLVHPSVEDIACILHKCRKERNLPQALRLHSYMRQIGLDAHISLENHLILMLLEVGSMCHGQKVFDTLVFRWNLIITGYAQCWDSQLALTQYQNMQKDDPPHSNRHNFVALLKACSMQKDLERGSKLHAEICRKGLLEKDVFLGSTLVDMYVKCGSLAKAQEVFNKLPVRDVVLWTALLAGYVEHGHGEEALKCVEQMQHEGISPDAFTLVYSLKACGSIGAMNKGQEMHSEIAKKGFLERNVFVGSILVDMYFKCGSLATAQKVFDKLLVRDVVSWNALLAGYAEYSLGEEAFNCFKRMQDEGISPNTVTLVCSLKACGSQGALDKGQEIHMEAVRKGLERGLLVSSTLVDMYAKCGSLVEAYEVFDNVPVRDVVSWNALIAGYTDQGQGEEAYNCFEQMRNEGIFPDAVTLVCSLKSCSIIGAAHKGQEIHAEIVKKGLERELSVGSILIDMYAKFGWLAEAQGVFDKIPVRDVISYTALISGYAEHEHGEGALYCFEQTQHEGISLNAIALVCSLKACGSIGATIKGWEIHAEIVRKGLEREYLVGNILIDMYAKCGFLEEAQEVFDKISVRDAVLWNTLIAGYAQLGDSENVRHIFDRMRGEGIKPSSVTLVGVLNACNHEGQVDKGQMYFDVISNDYGLIPTLEHYTCMVDLLGRAGHIDKAIGMIGKMPFHPDLVVWHTVLAACRKWGNVELGRRAFEHAVRLDEKDVAAYVCMSNIYADAALLEEANKVEAMRVEKQAWKKLGHCW